MKVNILIITLIFGVHVNYAQNNYPSTGNVGLGTNSPGAKLHVNNGDNSYGTILANASEPSFSLYAKSLSTQPIFTESFRLGMKYNSSESNGFISFYRGENSNGGFLGFSTNGIERIRIVDNGNVGIGTFNPTEKLEIYNSDTSPGVLSLRSNRNDSQFVDVGRISVKQGSVEVSRIGMPRSGETSTGYFTFWTKASNIGNLTEKVRITEDGNMGIGTVSPDAKLTVNGTIHSKEVKVDLNVPAPDYVFANDYKLKSLQEVENYINQNSHLPEIPSAKEFEKNGMQLAEMNMALLKKVEELTLYAIEQQKNTEKLTKVIEEQNKRLEVLEKGKISK